MNMRGKFVVWCLIFMLVIVCFDVAAHEQQTQQDSLGEYAPGEIILGYNASISVVDINSFQEHIVREKIKDINAALVLVEPGTEQAFITHARHMPSIRFADYNWYVHASLIPNDPLWNQQWGPQRIHCVEAWDSGTGSGSVTIGIVDTGIDYNHQDLAAHYLSGGHDWVNGDNDPMDDNNHGTHCAGIAAAVMSNGMGIAGVAQVMLLAEKVLNSDGEGTAFDVASGITHAADQGADVISMSFGSSGSSATIEAACSYAYNSKNVVLVAASGNDGQPQIDYPAAYDTVIAVGAIDQSDELCSFSNYGTKLDLVAPGYQIVSTIRNNQYDWFDGTSMACPHVAGVAALALSKHPGESNAWIWDLLVSSAEDLGTPGKDIYFGYGLVDARLADISNLTEVDKYANGYYQKDSGWYAWGDHGMECDDYWHPTRHDYIYYSFDVPQATPGPVFIGAEFRATSVPWNSGPDIDAYSPSNGTWVKIKQGMGTPSTLTWQWYIISKAFISGSSVLRFRVLCAGGCDTWLDTVGVKYAPVPPPAEPDLSCIGSLGWANVKPGSTVTGSFTVTNIGDPGSYLRWHVQECPTWGTWTFAPSSGGNLPKDGSVTVQVTVIAPSQGNQQFSGMVKVVNDDDAYDVEQIPVVLVTPLALHSGQSGLMAGVFFPAQGQCILNRKEHVLTDEQLVVL
jgi:thermitase